jgi:hypothetical protein
MKHSSMVDSVTGLNQKALNQIHASTWMIPTGVNLIHNVNGLLHKNHSTGLLSSLKHSAIHKQDLTWLITVFGLSAQAMLPNLNAHHGVPSIMV